MISRDDVQRFADTHTSFFNNNVTTALEAEASFIFECGLDREMDNDTRLWLQTYLPHDVNTRRDLCEQRRRVFAQTRPDV